MQTIRHQRVEELEELLAKNYEAIGWKLEKLELISYEEASCLPSHTILRGILVCPCGGREYFNMMVEVLELDAWKDPSLLAMDILRQSASKEHLQRDIDEGKLPAFDIDKHCFKGLV